MLTIVIFNMLVPFGRVLLSFGVLKITSGALFAGISRAVTLEGLIMLSKASIRGDLHLPGALGQIIGESFRLFALISEKRHLINRKNLVASLDALLIELTDAPEPAPSRTIHHSTVLGIVILAGAVLLAWAPWMLIIVGA
jgi:heptaprenyl diphosphate synthase